MRILVIDPPADLARDLQKRAFQSGKLALTVASASNPLVTDMGSSRFIPFQSKRKLDISSIRVLRREIQSNQPDLVHAFLPRGLAQTVLATAGMHSKPRIVSFYGITRVPTWRDPANWITYLSPRVAAHACESMAVKQALVQGGVAEDKCQVVYNCVSPTSSSSTRAELLARFNIPADAFVVGTVATIRPIKGIDVLLRALADCSHVPNIYALVAGSVNDPLVEMLAKDPRIADRIRMPGYLDGASSIMKAMDLFVMPSRKEGLCRALLEAMGQSICPVVSDAGGMKEIVRHNIDGIVFPSEDHHTLSNAILSLHGSKSRIARYRESALQRVQDMCSPSVVGDRMMQFYGRFAAAPVAGLALPIANC